MYGLGKDKGSDVGPMEKLYIFQHCFIKLDT